MVEFYSNTAVFGNEKYLVAREVERVKDKETFVKKKDYL